MNWFISSMRSVVSIGLGPLFLPFLTKGADAGSTTAGITVGTLAPGTALTGPGTGIPPVAEIPLFIIQ